MWIDQPANVGFSYGAAGDDDHDEAEVSEDMYNFLQAFFEEILWPIQIIRDNHKI